MTLEEIQPLQPDVNGIINVEVDGKIKRYLKVKLIDFLQRNPGAVLFKKPKIKRQPPIKRIKKIKAPKGPDMRGKHNKIPITATMPDGREIDFESSRAAVKELKLGKSSISNVLTGAQAHVQNIKFKFQKIA